MPVAKKRTKKGAEPVPLTEPVQDVASPSESSISVKENSEEGVCFDEHVLLQIPIRNEHLDMLLKTEEMQGILEYIPEIKDPEPYIPQNQFISVNDTLQCVEKDKKKNAVHGELKDKEDTVSGANIQEESTTSYKRNKICFWCCHEVGPMIYGMPIRYDTLSKSFTMYGNFCSLECAAAHNFGIHLGSDRAWEIHSWIQMLGKRYGYKDAIRPAPSRYLLQMFDGPLTIDEFRNAHKGQARTYVMNIPPLVSVNSQMELMNTSFLEVEPNAKTKRVTKKA